MDLQRRALDYLAVAQQVRVCRFIVVFQSTASHPLVILKVDHHACSKMSQRARRVQGKGAIDTGRQGAHPQRDPMQIAVCCELLNHLPVHRYTGTNTHTELEGA